MKNTRVHLVPVAILLAMGACLSEAPEPAPEPSEPGDDGEPTAIAVSASTSQCLSNTMCLWQDNGFAGAFKALAGNVPDFVAIGFGDRTTAALNRTAVSWVLFEHDTFRGRTACLLPNASVANLGNFNFNDIVSSAQRLSGTACPSGALVFSGVN